MCSISVSGSFRTIASQWCGELQAMHKSYMYYVGIWPNLCRGDVALQCDNVGLACHPRAGNARSTASTSHPDAFGLGSRRPVVQLFPCSNPHRHNRAKPATNYPARKQHTRQWTFSTCNWLRSIMGLSALSACQPWHESDPCWARLRRT